MEKNAAVELVAAKKCEPAEAPGPSTPESSRNTDGRALGAWESRWPMRVWAQIGIETIYIVAVTGIAFWMIYAGWMDNLPDWLVIPPEKKPEFVRSWIYSFAGLLGGVLFGIKWLYHSVARGLWNVDRVLWRLLSPWISFCIAFAVSFMTAGGALNVKGSEGVAGWITFGFLVGLFSDTAMGKMQEVVYVIFGSPKQSDGAGGK